MKTTLILLILLSMSPAVAAKPVPLAPEAVVQINLKDLVGILLPRAGEALPADVKALLVTIEARLAAIELLLRSLAQPVPLPPVVPPPAGALETP